MCVVGSFGHFPKKGCGDYKNEKGDFDGEILRCCASSKTEKSDVGDHDNGEVKAVNVPTLATVLDELFVFGILVTEGEMIEPFFEEIFEKTE